MKLKYMSVSFICLAYILLGECVSAQTDDPLCFRFTWLGPQFNANTTMPNTTTCAEHLNDIRNLGVPCRQPFVITYDATPPDIEFLWMNHASDVTCRRAPGSVCAKFTYTFNGFLQNTTYMCTQAYSVGEGAQTSGCFSQTVDGQLVEVCLCESVVGQRPCNGTTSLNMSVILIVTLIMAIIL